MVDGCIIHTCTHYLFRQKRLQQFPWITMKPPSHSQSYHLLLEEENCTSSSALLQTLSYLHVHVRVDFYEHTNLRTTAQG